MTVAQVHQIYQLEIAPDILIDLKDEYRSVINSRRRESCINCISDLIDILWKRNVLRKETCQSMLLNRFKNASDRQILYNYIEHLDYSDHYGISADINGK